MSRVRLDKTAFKLRDDDLLALAPSRAVYVYARGTTDEVDAYSAEVGGVVLPQPLTADAHGKYDAWVPPGSYDLHTPADLDTEPWEALSAGDVGGRELDNGYAETTTTATSTTTQGNGADIAGLSITVDTPGGREIMLHVHAPWLYNTSTGQSVIYLLEGTTHLGEPINGDLGANIVIGVDAWRRVTPSAGSHTFKAALARNTAAGTATLFASSTVRPFIRATWA